jgi:CRISPR/Cas system-associated exonuclease Cas4 (RecB family)
MLSEYVVNWYTSFMAAYQQRTWKPKLYDPTSSEPFKLSRSKIDQFIECPRCFYLDRRLGVAKPQGPAFTLNVAVDALLKKEFDVHRARGTPHPYMTRYGVNAIPFAHENIDEWRENFVGVRFLHKPTNLIIFGAVDDVWKAPDGSLHIVDYKATSKEDGVKELSDTKWHNQYRRQMEIYQWLMRKNGFPVSPVGYFVYVNGRKDKEAFDGKLEFDVAVIPYTGNDEWVEQSIIHAKACLDAPQAPKASDECEYCSYRTQAGKVLQALQRTEQGSDTKRAIPATVVKKSSSKKTAPPLPPQTLF